MVDMNTGIVYLLRKIIQTLKRLLAKFSSRVTTDQTNNLDVSIQNNKVRVYRSGAEENSRLPQFAEFSLLFENNADIAFEVDEIVLWVEAKSSHMPNLGDKRRETFPVANIREEKIEIVDDNFSQVSAISTSIDRRKGSAGENFFRIQFFFPGWMTNIETVYVDGILKLQKEATKQFSDKTSSITVV